MLLIHLMMPRVDGFGVIEFLRRHPAAQKPVVLVITAYADQKFKEVDPTVVTGVVRKPFEVAELGNLVRLCVDGFESAVRDASFELAPEGWAVTEPPAPRGDNGVQH